MRLAPLCRRVTAFAFTGDGNCSPKKCLRPFASLQQGGELLMWELQEVFAVRAVPGSFENSHTPRPVSSSRVSETKGKQITDEREQRDPCRALGTLPLATSTSFSFQLGIRSQLSTCHLFFARVVDLTCILYRTDIGHRIHRQALGDSGGFGMSSLHQPLLGESFWFIGGIQPASLIHCFNS